jgi:hypothetical protein
MSIRYTGLDINEQDYLLQFHQSFCLQRRFADGVLVTEQNLVLWLTTVIVPRGSQQDHKRKKVFTAEGEVISEPPAYTRGE